MLSTMKTMLVLIIVIAILLGSIIIYNLGILSYTEKEYQFATLKVLGFKDKQVENIFIKQNNWIAIVSIIIGTLFGFILFLLHRSKIKILRIISLVFVRFLQGVPVTVLLLTFYFGIFGSINIEPIIVAVIAFSIYFSAYVCEIIKGAFSSINRTQIDSAYALGFTKIQTFKYIVFPQVLSYVIPVYKNESVSLIKSTSIAGYISVMELTKVSDIIRNRTYEAFFPLIFIALIYFIICYAFCKLLDLIYKKVNPRMVKKS